MLLLTQDPYMNKWLYASCSYRSLMNHTPPHYLLPYPPSWNPLPIPSLCMVNYTLSTLLFFLTHPTPIPITSPIPFLPQSRISVHLFTTDLTFPFYPSLIVHLPYSAVLSLLCFPPHPTLPLALHSFSYCTSLSPLHVSSSSLSILFPSSSTLFTILKVYSTFPSSFLHSTSV